MTVQIVNLNAWQTCIQRHSVGIRFNLWPPVSFGGIYWAHLDLDQAGTGKPIMKRITYR